MAINPSWPPAGAKLCADGYWRYDGDPEPIGWTMEPAIVEIQPDGSEKRIRECRIIKQNVWR